MIRDFFMSLKVCLNKQIYHLYFCKKNFKLLTFKNTTVQLISGVLLPVILNKELEIEKENKQMAFLC